MAIDDARGSTYIDVSKIEWEPTPFPGVWTKRLYSDASGRMTVVTRMEPGARLPDHRHVGLEQSFVLEGSLVDADLEIGGERAGTLRLASPVTLPALGSAAVELSAVGDAAIALTGVGRALGSGRPLDYALKGALTLADGRAFPFVRRGQVAPPRSP